MQAQWRQDAVPLFLIIAFPIHVWSYYNFMRELPAWLARLNIGDLIATIGLSQMLPLIESVIVFVPFLLLANILSRRLDKDERLATLFCVLVVSTIWSIVFHFVVDSIRYWRLQFLPLGILYLFTNALPVWLILRSKSVLAGIHEAIERLNVLSAVYLAVDFVCLLIVLWFLIF